MCRLGEIYHSVAILIALALSGSVASAISLPAGTGLEIRLQQQVNSFSSDKGDTVRAVVIAPVREGKRIAIPAGSYVHGKVTLVHRVGLGLVHERAALQLVFDRLEFPDGRVIPIVSRLWEIDNSRESVDEQGRVRGIRSTETPGYRASGFLTSLAAVDPIALVFTTAAFATMLRFSEPEIEFPAGTDLRLILTEPLQSGDPWPDSAMTLMAGAEGHAALRSLIKGLPFRTRTRAGNRESDITNLVFVGSRERLQRAFRAAGWVEAAEPTPYTKYRALRSFAETQGFQEAPMSALLLNGQFPTLNLSKSLNTFFKRHHLRVYETNRQWEGEPVFTASSTHDIGIGVARQKFIHRIDGNIDVERTKVLNDLLFTGCVAWTEQVDRPWVPKTSVNATGDRLSTDARIEIVHLNECVSPRRFDETIADSPGPSRGNQVERIGRQTILTLRNDLIRGNVVYQTVAGIKLARRFVRSRSGDARVSREQTDANDKPEPNSEIPEAMSFVAKRMPSSTGGPTLGAWEPARVELGFRLSNVHLGGSTAGPEGLLIQRTHSGSAPLGFTTDSQVQCALSMGAVVTLHTHRYISHEMSYQYQRGKFRLGLMGVDASGNEAVITGLEEQRVGLVIRQFSYNTLIHLRRPESRVRPYLAAGPALQLANLNDAPFRKARGVWRFGLDNVGMLRASYDFGRTAPLEGGGIFQTAAQVGGGVRMRLFPRFTLTLDYRNSISKPLDFLSKSLKHERPDLSFGELQLPAAGTPMRGRMSQHRIGTGLAFTF